MESNRREFLKKAGLVVLSVTVGDIALGHDGGHLSTFSEEQDLLIIQSGPGRLVSWKIAHHHHYIEIPVADLLNPPAEGIVVYTNWQLAHFHGIDISQQDLMNIRDGRVVVLEDRAKDHEFHLRLPNVEDVKG